MIITCNNCNKRFDIDSNLISDKGRLLQCASCDHKWFFKKEVLQDTVNSTVEGVESDNINIFDQNNPSNNEEITPSNIAKDAAEVHTEEKIGKDIEINTEEEPEKITEVNKNEDIPVKDKPKNFKILNLSIVAIISFVALIIIVDTFKYPIGRIVPNIDLILYNLYESIKDISLFIRDLT